MPKCMECGYEGSRLQWTHFKYKCTGRFQNGKEYLICYPNAKLLDDSIAEKTAITLENLKKKYGDSEGSLRWESYRNKQASSNTFAYKKEKYGWTAAEFDAYNKSRAITLNNLILKYGETEGLEKWNLYCEKQRISCSISYFKSKWGDEEGSKRFYDWRKKWHCTGNSEKIVYRELLKIDPTMQQQIRISHKQDKRYGYFYDFGCTQRKKCIEFNGTMWHADPRIYNSDEIIPIINKTAREIWIKDQDKCQTATTNGYKLYIIWEDDWKISKDKILMEIKSWWYEE